MAKTPITQARDVDAELVLQLNKFGSAADLRSQQANQQVEHAKEKRDREEKQAKKRRELRGRLAKQLVASNYPLPGNTLALQSAPEGLI